MRRGITLGLGLAGALAAGGSAAAQFAADRTNPPPQPAPAAPMPPAPAPALAPPPTPAPQPAAPPAGAQPESHPWYVRPEHGPWMICIKGYVGPESQKLAEELATFVRERYKAPAYLFEWGAEERRKEEARRALVRQKLAEQQAPFLAAREKAKAEAVARGVEFIDAPVTLRLPRIEFQEQWAVLVGGFKSQEAAYEALKVVRKWSPPESTRLLDQAVIADGTQGTKEQAYINPFATAMTAPNPSVRRSADGHPAADPALAKLNEAEPLSLLKTRKPWTLMVKRFIVPTQVQSKSGDVSLVDRLFKGDNSAKWLEATAKQARVLAEALRNEKMKPHPFEAFVLHYRTESLVTVGQFDGPDDPAMLEMWRVLNGMTFLVDFKDGRPPETRKMFDAIIPMQVPRPQ